MSAVHQSRVGGEQLNRRNLNMIALADSFTRVAIALIGNTIGFRDANSGAISHLTGPKYTSDFLFGGACRKPEAKLASGLDQLISSQALPERRKIIVARVSDRLRWSEGRQMILMNAGDRKTKPGEPARTYSSRILIDQTTPQRGQRSERFHRGTGHQWRSESHLRIHHCSNATTLRIHHDDGAGSLAESFFRYFLKLGIDLIFVRRTILARPRRNHNVVDC